VSENSPQQRDIFSEATGRHVLVQERAAVGEARGTMLLLHGLGDHVGRHRWMSDMVNEAGFDVVAVDWPGNGGSPGIRGDIPEVEKAGQLIEDVLAETKVKPVGIFAHSTGGYLLVHWMAKRPACLEELKWVLFSSPLIVPSHEQSPTKISLARKLSRVAPKLSLSTGVGLSDCYSPESQQRFEKLRIMADGVHNRVSLRFAASLLDSEAEFWSAVKNLPGDVAYLITEGSEDMVCPFPYAIKFFAALPGESKIFIVAAGSRHEPFRETARAGFMNGARAWLGKVAAS